jgi:SsrA-binding protein
VKLDRETANSGTTIVPLSIYFSDGYAKVEIALATGKKDWDKRHSIAEREANREAARALATRNRRS